MTRVEMFSDAVIAIAITLLVLELPFDEVGHGDLADALGEHWASFAAYALSFLGIGLMWLHHHAIFAAVARVDRRLVLVNLLMLFGAAFLPFPTALVGDYLPDGGEDARIAAVLYSASWVVISAAAATMVHHVLRTPGLLSKDVSPEGAERLLRKFQAATVAYLALTAVGAVSAIATIAGYGVAAVYFLSRSDYRALGRQTLETSAPPAEVPADASALE